MWPILIWIVLGRLVDSIGPFKSAVTYTIITGALFFIFPPPPYPIPLILGVRFIVSWLLFWLIDHFGDNVLLWWLILVGGGIALFFV